MRPTKMTPEAVDAFAQAIRLGATRDLAAAAAGWSTSTAYAYLDAGRAAQAKAENGERLTAKERRSLEFLEATQKAEAVMAQAALAQIVRAAQSAQHWTAAAWLLERRFPDKYGRRPVEVAGPGGGPIPVEVTAGDLLDQLRRMSDDEEKVAEHRRRLRVVVPEAVGNGHDPNYRDHLDEEG